MSTTLKKYNLQGEELGAITVSNALAEATAHSQLIKDYIVALRANARQWSANTKGRSEMKHTTKKPHPQKHQGRSRQGSLVAPQYRGGGRVFGPKPRTEFHVRINQQEKRAAIRALIGEKIREGLFIVVDSLAMAEPKTKMMSDFLENCGCEKRVLVLGEAAFIEIGGEELNLKMSVSSLDHDNVKKSVRNLPGVKFSLATDIDGYCVACAHHLVISEAALKQLEQWLGERA